MQRLNDEHALPLAATTAFNWSVACLLIVLCLLTRYTQRAHCLVCPLLTVFVYYYMIAIQYSKTEVEVDVVYYSLVVGLTLQFFILVMFSENWLLSTAIFIPCVVYFMSKS